MCDHENQEEKTGGFSAVLFDLDGTITNSGPGIMKSAAYALRQMGKPPAPESELRKFVGPSLQYAFTNILGFSEEEAQMGISLYRAYYRSRGIFDAVLYDGICDVIQTLFEQGVKLFLVTTKPHIYAKQILEHYDLKQYFLGVFGPEFHDTSSQKVRLIRAALEKEHLDRHRTVMVGDTHFDMEGARQAGVITIGVTYGYGSREELISSGADILADTPADILRCIEKTGHSMKKYNSEADIF